MGTPRYMEANFLCAKVKARIPAQAIGLQDRSSSPLCSASWCEDLSVFISLLSAAHILPKRHPTTCFLLLHPFSLLRPPVPRNMWVNPTLHLPLCHFLGTSGSHPQVDAHHL
ncbi:hypothetical protein H1C71_023590 [Ictidomys tridecemlineatus]|nr:hypothetical protein H1C71_023590 [Ictidomys tridecemlineatus]